MKIHENRRVQVFQSAAHMADTYYWYTYLERPSDDAINDFILDQYDVLYRCVACAVASQDTCGSAHR